MSVNSTITDVHLTTCAYFNLFNRVLKVILLLPLCTYVLYLGNRQWQLHRCFPCHSDLFIFNLATMELLWIFGFFCMICRECTVITAAGNCATRVAFYGEMFCHVLTSVERYLAVVYPIFYRGLRSTQGFRIKALSIGGVWLLSFGLAFLNLGIHSEFDSVPLLCFLIISILATSFCSFYALCALIRPRPGLEKNEQIEHSKRRAFHTIILLWSILCLWFVMLLFQVIIRRLPLFSKNAHCLADMALNWLNLCSSLVLPMLFLHKEGKIPCDFNN